MKRGAESYITKDTGSDDEIEEIPGEGFRKADEAVLATRKIRGLPKRSHAGTPSASPAPSLASLPEAVPITSPKFDGFTRFGTPSSSFTFTPLSPATASSSSTTSVFRGSAPLPSSGPTVAPTASSTAKTFASFLEDSPSKFTPAPAPSSSDENIDVDDSTAYKYYTSLRGLNVSLLAAVSKATEEDPFADISDLLERYKSLRLNVQKEFDERPKSTSHPAPPKPTSMPAPPAKFTGFGAPSTLTQPSPGESSGGFVIKPVSSSSTPASGFSFTPTPSPAQPTTSSAGFSFATPPPSQASVSATSNPFALPSSSNTPSTFGSVFGGSTTSPFGTSAKNTTAPASVGFGAPPSTNSTSSLFGNTTLTSSTTNVFGSDKSSASAFAATVLSTTSASKRGTFGGFGGFGKPAGTGGSIGNPVGFGFGSPTKTADGDVSAGRSGASSPLSIGSEKKSDGTEEGGETVEDQSKASTFSLSGSNPHDEEGEGEEQEDTVHAVKLRAFRLKKADETGGSGWAELGYGVLRLKKHKETESRRLLLRNSSTGKININFNLYSGLRPSQSKKTVTFVGHDEGVSQTYSVRLQGDEQAKLLKDMLDREIAFVKAKSDD